MLQILTAGYPLTVTEDILCLPKQDSSKCKVVLQHCRAGLEGSDVPQKKPNKAVSALEDPADYMKDDATGKDKCADLL